jgi:hypothetical protein
MAFRRFYRYAYSLRGDVTGSPALHKLRDGDAFIELMPVLSSLGAVCGGTLLNLPGEDQDDTSGRFLGSLGPSDLIVVTTRPPLHDRSEEIRRALIPTGAVLETAIHQALRCCFKFCNRSKIHLVRSLGEQLKSEYADREQITFRVYKKKPPMGANAAYQYLQADYEGNPHRPKFAPRTAVFLIRTALWKNGPTVLNAFGMSGNQGLIWAHLLKTRHPEFLTGCGPLFYMGEVTLQDIPPRPLDLTFADSWEVKTLIKTSRVPQVLRKPDLPPAGRSARRPHRGGDDTQPPP